MLELDSMVRNREGYGGTLATATMPLGMYQGQFGGAQSGNGFYPTSGHPFSGYPGNGSPMGQQYGNYYDGSMAEFGAHMHMASGPYGVGGMPNAQSPDHQQQLGNVQQLPVPEDSRDLDDPPITPPPARERFSYTRYQLELLNAIFIKVRYPNTIQKQLIAKRVGIRRDQVKIWFQNRRRKDVVANQKAADGIPVELPRTTTPEAQMVPPDVMSGVLRELMKYDGDYKKQLKMKAKPKSKSATDRAKPYDLSKSGHQRNRSDSQGYDTSPRANSVSSGGSPGYDYDAQGHFNKSPSLTCTMPMSAMFSHTSPEGFPASFSSTFSSTPSTGYHSNQSSPPQSVATPSAYQHSANSSASSTPPAGANQSVRSPYNSSPINLAGASAISPENQQNVRLSEDQQSLCGKSSSPINETSKSTQHSIPSNEQLDMIAPPNAVAPQDFDLPPMYPLSALESPKNKSPQNESEKSNELDSSSDSCHDPATSSSQSLSVDIPTSSEGPPSSTPATTTPYSWHVPAGHMMSGASGGENAMTSHYPHQMSAYPPNQTIPPNFHGYGGFGEMNMRSYSGGNDSKVNLDRVFPFPLVAEQAMRFTSFPPYTPEGYGSSMKNEATGSYRDHYQPLLIASYANPYYGQDVKGESQCKSDVYII